MARVRALTRCYFNFQSYESGVEFDYDGPPRSCLQLIEGDWQETKKGAKADADRLKSENEKLRARLAQLEADRKRSVEAGSTTMPTAQDGSPVAVGTRRGRKAASPIAMPVLPAEAEPATQGN